MIRSGRLRGVAALAEYTLDEIPVFDGLIAAQGKLYLSMKDGTVRCWGPDR